LRRKNILQWPRFLPEFFADKNGNRTFWVNQHLVYAKRFNKQYIVLRRIMALMKKIR
jgi:hypothetical protein